MCTGVCFLLQTIGQKYTPPSAAAVILTLESVFGTLLSILFYHERLTLRVAAGFVLIFAAVLILGDEAELSPARARGVERIYALTSAAACWDDAACVGPGCRKERKNAEIAPVPAPDRASVIYRGEDV